MIAIQGAVGPCIHRAETLPRGGCGDPPRSNEDGRRVPLAACPPVHGLTRREFLARTAAASAAVGAALAWRPRTAFAGPAPPAAKKSRVVVIRHEALAAEGEGPAAARVREFLDEAAAALSGQAKPADGWAQWVKPADTVGIKVNCLGYPTRPAVAQALVLAFGAAGLAPAQMTIWDRTLRELKTAGYELGVSPKAARCIGTDTLASRGNSGYTEDIVTSGAIGSLFSRIVTDETTALVSASILKDHNLAGLSCSLKNFFGAIHNPNKYHDGGCDPFVADVCAAKPIRERLRLAVCDALRPQYNGGPSTRPQWQWPYGGLIVSTDAVALDRVAATILARKREAAGRKSLEDEKRPVRYLVTAEARGLGIADLAQIEVVSIGKPWMDVG